MVPSRIRNLLFDANDSFALRHVDHHFFADVFVATLNENLTNTVE